MHPDDLSELAQEEIERFTIATSIPCQASLDALTMAPAHSCEQVLRVISEGLTNIARHARAHQVWVCATARTDILEVEIGDDGTGFDPASVINLAGHYGLRGLRERARLVGGQLDINSAPGKGTCMRLRMPQAVQPEQEASDSSNESASPSLRSTTGKESTDE
jgi:two-component system, NarL family, sensor histidine kinase YdfH